MKKSDELKMITVQLPQALYDKLKQDASNMNLSISAYIRLLIANKAIEVH